MHAWHAPVRAGLHILNGGTSHRTGFRECPSRYYVAFPERDSAGVWQCALRHARRSGYMSAAERLGGDDRSRGSRRPNVESQQAGSRHSARFHNVSRQ